MDSKPFTKNCWSCCQPFAFATEIDALYFQSCNACHLKAEADRDNQKREARLAKWRELCPSDFQSTVMEKLPCQTAAQKVMAWQFNRRGLVLHGVTGTGKSRCAWMLLEKFFLSGKKVDVLNSLSGVLYAARFGESASAVEKWLHKMITVDILFMDDIFKNKLTDSFEGAIFSIIDQRTENGRPIIVTANDTGSTLTSRMSGDRGEPMVRRLREFCDGIIFEK